MAHDFVGCLPKRPYVKNCAVYEREGVCRYCKTNYYLDQTDSVCKLRVASTDISGCLYYSQLMKC